jgi:hypothetical protein
MILWSLWLQGAQFTQSDKRAAIGIPFHFELAPA